MYGRGYRYQLYFRLSMIEVAFTAALVTLAIYALCVLMMVL
ncbi:hypothetical protein [Bradyrhizobium jicamae]|nr:hypothetical protein [Bradyrhizobium jicamae]